MCLLQILRGDILPAQFARFQKYARYVRTVAGATNIIDYSVFRQLYYFNHERPLLPSLRDYCCAGPGSPLSFIYVVPPHLQALNLTLSHWSYEIPYPASQVALTLRFGSDLTFLSDFKYLASLDLRGSLCVLDSRLLRILADMEKLRVLKADTVDLSSDFNAALPLVVFHALEHLSLSADTQHSIHLLSVISTPVLRTLEWDPSTDVTDIEDYRHFLECLSSKYASSLHGLDLSFQLNRTPPLTTSGYRYILDPLLSFHHLRSISITFDLPSPALSLSENDVRDFAKAWPEATDICLILRCATPAPALSSLIHFARHCPNLKSLNLDGLDLGTVSAVDQLDPLPLHRLTHLSICDNFWDTDPDPVAVAEFLDAVFPHLQLQDDDPGWRALSWKTHSSRPAVNSHLRALRLARQH
ncbi:hypothetical protein A0H81_09447 [Grifola frondosa]|uniref:F-box domain-containing protein n=1 Tax=Grifola frondosa TaxID=5627 RepID=A0A1C7M2E6_GRIFR|nr:hypothetical protein A0H81_09447 [Grifola frondosa]